MLNENRPSILKQKSEGKMSLLLLAVVKKRFKDNVGSNVCLYKWLVLGDGGMYFSDFEEYYKPDSTLEAVSL